MDPCPRLFTARKNTRLTHHAAHVSLPFYLIFREVYTVCFAVGWRTRDGTRAATQEDTAEFRSS